MDLVVDLGAGALVLVLLVGALAVWRISQVTSWRALAMTARATGSFAECVAFIRFCAEEASDVRGIRQLKQQRGIPPRPGLRRALDKLPRTS